MIENLLSTACGIALALVALGLGLLAAKRSGRVLAVVLACAGIALSLPLWTIVVTGHGLGGTLDMGGPVPDGFYAVAIGELVALGVAVTAAVRRSR